MYNPAKNPTGPGVAAGRPTPALAPAVANFSSTHYKQVRNALQGGGGQTWRHSENIGLKAQPW